MEFIQSNNTLSLATGTVLLLLAAFFYFHASEGASSVNAQEVSVAATTSNTQVHALGNDEADVLGY